jgi:tRNA 2-thiouridine synthesizing protein A
MADQLLDAKGLNCPLPILRAKKALKDVAMGGTLEVLATDPGAVKDFEAFCRATGNELLASNVEGKVYSFVIKRLSYGGARGGTAGSIWTSPATPGQVAFVANRCFMRPNIDA